MNYLPYSKRAEPLSLNEHLFENRFIRLVVIVAILLSDKSHAVTPEIHTSKGRNGIVFRHFEYVLTPDNTVLKVDHVARELLNENSEQFKYGQFEVLIPVNAINLPSNCQRYFIARMPQSIDLENHQEIQSKQTLFFKIKHMLETKTGEIPVVFEYPKDCNIFFRSSNGRYIDYVGQLKN